MKFKQSTHPDFELELVQDGMLLLTGYLNSPEEFKEFAKKSEVRPYVFELDRDFHIVSRKPGFVSWQDEYPGWTAINDGDELVNLVVNLINRKELDYSSLIPFINKFQFGLKSELNIYNGFDVKRVSRDSVQYGNFYQGVKLI